MNHSNTKERNISFDVLRIISALSVVILHVSTKFIMMNEVGSLDFKIANFINSISRFGVPVFFMISGAIFLDEKKEVTVKKIWLHNILRMMILFCIWSFVYYIYQSIYFWDFDFWNQGIARTIYGCVFSSEHFWFLFTLSGLYALTPILRTWIHNAKKKDIEYLLLLYIVFQIMRMTVILLIDRTLIQRIMDDIRIIELTGYLGYFILGYYLVKYGLSTKLKIAVYCTVPFGIAINYLVSNRLSEISGTYTPGIYDSFGIFTFINIVALFVLVNDICKKVKFPQFVQKVTKNVALDTFGIYIMHIAVLDYVLGEELVVGHFNEPVEIIIITAICFVFCGTVAAVLRRIPFVGRYLC